MAIYPEITIIPIQNGRIRMSTSLRKQADDGIWYLWVIVKYSLVESQARNLDELHQLVYYTLIHGRIDPLALDGFGEPLFRRDEDQRSEETRIECTQYIRGLLNRQPQKAGYLYEITDPIQ